MMVWFDISRKMCMAIRKPFSRHGRKGSTCNEKKTMMILLIAKARENTPADSKKKGCSKKAIKQCADNG